MPYHIGDPNKNLTHKLAQNPTLIVKARLEAPLAGVEATWTTGRALLRGVFCSSWGSGLWGLGFRVFGFRDQGFRASDLPGPTPTSLAILNWPNMISNCNGLEKVGDLRPGSV